MVSSLPKLAILGAGNMGGAILRGILAHPGSVASLRVTTQSARSAESWRAEGLEVRSLEDDADANAWAVDGADVIVVAVKPRYVTEVLQSIASVASSGAVVVSVAAGVTIAQMEEVWPGAVIRTMPNTPSEIGRGVTGVALGTAVSEDQVQHTLDLLAVIGQVLVVPEESINALSAFSGSGPAFVYYFIEKYVQVAKDFGFSKENAETMVLETVRGALELLDASGKEPQQLRQDVTSPGGSTAAALAVWESADLSDIITRATKAAIARAEELSGR